MGLSINCLTISKDLIASVESNQKINATGAIINMLSKISCCFYLPRCLYPLGGQFQNAYFYNSVACVLNYHIDFERIIYHSFFLGGNNCFVVINFNIRGSFDGFFDCSISKIIHSFVAKRLFITRITNTRLT